MVKSSLKRIAKSACDGLLPLSIGAAEITEVEQGQLTLLSPLKGKEKVAAEALKAAHGVAWPAPNRATAKGGVRAVWFGHGLVMLMGTKPAITLTKLCANTEQEDGWAQVSLSGAGARAVLARLTPLDLRDATFKRGHTARSELGHMMASITRTSADAYLIMTFRSMAGTLVHDLKTAAEAVAARG